MIKIISGGGTSYADAVKNSANHISVQPSLEKCIYVISNITSINDLSKINDLHVENEIDRNSIKDEFKKYLFEGHHGGTIVFSTDVNSKIFSINPFKDWIIKKFNTIKNRFTISSFLNKLRNKENITAWTIGRYFVGTYTGRNDITYNENSMTLNVIGIDRKTLFKLAQEICKFLNQESVLVHDATTKQIYFVTAD